MTTKRNIAVRIAKWTFGSLAVLIIALAIHIYVSTNPEDDGHTRMQLARIDFSEPVDSTTAGTIKAFVAKIPGVRHCYFNIPDGKLVYGFIQGQQNSDRVYQLLMASGNYKAQKYVASEQMMRSGCPIMSRNDFMRRVGMYFARFTY